MKLTQWSFILCALLLVQPRILAQEQDKPIVVSPLIGDTLDVNERGKYPLFPNLDGFGNETTGVYFNFGHVF